MRLSCENIKEKGKGKVTQKPLRCLYCFVGGTQKKQTGEWQRNKVRVTGGTLLLETRQAGWDQNPDVGIIVAVGTNAPNCKRVVLASPRDDRSLPVADILQVGRKRNWGQGRDLAEKDYGFGKFSLRTREGWAASLLQREKRNRREKKEKKKRWARSDTKKVAGEK